MEYYKDFIVDLSVVNRAKSFKNFLAKDGEYDGRVELICISRLFPKHLLMGIVKMARIWVILVVYATHNV